MTITRNQSKLIKNFQHVELGDNIIAEKNNKKNVSPAPKKKPVKCNTSNISKEPRVTKQSSSATEEEIRLNDLRWDILMKANSWSMEKREQGRRELEAFDNKYFPENSYRSRNIA